MNLATGRPPAPTHSPQAETIRSVLARLDHLTTPDEVADVFRNVGVKGTQLDVCDCPVARFVRGRTDFARVVVSGASVRAYDANSRCLARVELPRHVRMFIQAFDRGEYADLSDGRLV